MRGGSFAMIGPGNSAGSRLYLRLIGSEFGTQMPPTGALKPEQIKIIKDWIDQGAEWPDELSGDAPPRPTPPLMTAVLQGDAAAVRKLLDEGAGPNVANDAGATALMWAVGDAETAQLLLDRGAHVNARSADGRTPLAIAAGVAGNARVVKLLPDHGADPAAKLPDGQNAASAARRRGNSAVVEALKKAGVADAGVTAASSPKPAPAVSPRAAVERSLPLLQQSDVTFLKKAGCVSCHNNSLTALAVALARSHGIRVDEEIAQDQSEKVVTYLESWRERALQGIGIAGESDTVSYILFGLSAEAVPPSPATDAMARFLLRQQSGTGP